MVEPNVRPFQAEITYDLPTYKKLTASYDRYLPRTNMVKVVVILLLLIYSLVFGHMQDNSYSSGGILLLCLGIFWGAKLVQHLRSRDGGSSYKRMLSSNGGSPVHYDYSFLSDGIHIFNPHTNGSTCFPYSQVKAVFETDDLFVIELEHKQLLPLEKSTLTGGPASTFVEKLLAASPNAKKKKLTSLLPGKLIHGALILVSLGVLLYALWLTAPVQGLLESNRSIHNSMSYQQIAEELTDLGIHDIPASVIEELEAYDEEYNYTYTYQMNKCLDLLCWAGVGEYDLDTWEWTPSECGVYWFDSEVFGLETMYSDFLRGVSALDSEALAFTNIQENTDQVNWELGAGKQSVSFSWNGQDYTLTGQVHYDWFDLDVAVDLNDILKSQGTGKQLYFAWDQGQGYLVFYGDAQWAQAFQKATGIRVTTDPYALDAIF